MMLVSARTSVLVVAGCALLAACSSSAQRVQSLPAAPAQPVQSAALQPPPQLAPVAPLEEEPIEEEVEVVATPDPATGVDIGRTDLLGGWAVSSGGETCQLFMSLTQWEGGYRASTRGCASPSLSSISAWELAGRQIQLKAEGATVATLVAADESRFNGATTDGDAITVQR